DAVHLSQATDADGAYVFLNLRPGCYTITETQPAGYTQGTNSLGTIDGVPAGAISAIDRFDLCLAARLDALHYNFAQPPAATGGVRAGQTASSGFWNNKNGQALMKALNGGASSTQLGDWLGATFPRMFGALSGGNGLAGKTNADVAAFFQGRFILKGEK